MLIRRRDVIAGMGGLALTGLAYRAHAQPKPERITVATYGGVFERAMRETFVADFTRRTGIEVDLVLGTALQWVSQVEASPQKPPLDVLLGSVNLVIEGGRKGLFEKPSAENLKKFNEIPPFFVDICEGWGVTFDYGATGLAYHKERVANPPKSFVEFIERTEKGDWIASIPSINNPTAHTNLIWSFNDILGGTLDDITPVIEAIKRMKPNLIFWSAITDFLVHLKNGDADIGLYLDGRTWSEYEGGETWIDFINPTEGAVMGPNAALKPVNASPWAWEFIDSMLDAEQQSKFADIIFYGMTNKNIVYSPQVANRITPWEKTRLPPVEEIGKRIPLWVERWNKEIGG